jgi:hypothetical protein
MIQGEGATECGGKAGGCQAGGREAEAMYHSLLKEYTLDVRDERAPGYVSPYDPQCTAGTRYLAVHTPDGSWGIVDRRTGELLGADQRSDTRRYVYVYQSDVRREVDRLNEGAVR